MRSEDDALDEIEAAAAKKLSTFPALSRDVYQSFYSLMPKRNEESELSCMAQRFNQKILDHVTNGEEFKTIKNICEGRELPAYEAATEFISQTAGELDHLIAGIGGEKGALNTLNRRQQAEEAAEEELAGLLERLRQTHGPNETLEAATVEAANKAESLHRQVTAIGKQIEAATAKNKDAIAGIISRSAKAAAEKAEEVQSIIAAWGDSSGGMERNAVNTALLTAVRKSDSLKDIRRLW